MINSYKKVTVFKVKKIMSDLFATKFTYQEIEMLFDHAHFTSNEFMALLEQCSSSENAQMFSYLALNANVSISNLQEASSILKSMQKCNRSRFFDIIIKILDQTNNEMSILQDTINNLHSDLDNILDQKHEYNKERDKFILKIGKYKKSKDARSIYQLLDKLYTKGYQDLFLMACEKDLRNKNFGYCFPVLGYAIREGNFNVVKSLVENGYNTMQSSVSEYPLHCASQSGNLDFVKYFISIGNDIEAKQWDGSTPLLLSLIHI